MRTGRAPAPRTAPPAAVGRLAVQSLGTHWWGMEGESSGSAAELLRVVHGLKALARSARLAVMLSVPAGVPFVHIFTIQLHRTSFQTSVAACKVFQQIRKSISKM